MAVQLSINGKPFTVPNDLPSNTTLNEFIREQANLKGTKFMCLEGGCGSCIVSVQFVHPSTRKIELQAVNSCLVPIYTCHGWTVTTVEGIGNKTIGYDKIQKRLAAANGTQCGYCSPGMVMNMYSLLKNNPKITMNEIENSFGGNICRCTGYRPILDAFKSFASDAPKELVQKIADIEDMVCQKSGQACKKENCSKSCSPVAYPSLHLVLKGGTSWMRPTSIKEIFEIFDLIGDKSYRLVVGNTGHGVYRIEKEYEVNIDVNGVSELRTIDVNSSGITLGGNVTLTEAMTLFYKLSKEKPSEFGYCQTMADHIDLIANVPVRNTGSIGGNLFMKYAHNEFPSDVFLILEMVGAQVVIAEKTGMEKCLSLLEYLTIDMNQKVISKILLPVLNEQYVTRSFKIMPRAQNAHAYVNAGFLAKVEKQNGFLTLEKPTVLFGGIAPKFLHASKTEEYLTGKKLLDETTVKEALSILASELNPDHVLPDATPAYRSGLAQSLLFKFIVGLNPSQVDPPNKSAGPLLERPISSGMQDFETKKENWPLSKPIPKLESVIQCSGEAEYTNDMPKFPDQLWGQLVLCGKARATISEIDASEALKLQGVVAFLSAKDIPGKNTFNEPFYPNSDERVFAGINTVTDYAGQAVGVILADSHANAIQAAKKVRIVYSKTDKVMVDMREIISNNVKDRIKEMSRIDPTDNNPNGHAKYKVKGKIELKSQYHYTMETQTCLAVPSNDDALDVYPASQWPAYAQEAISLALNIPQHKINYRIKRLGGGYGAKSSRSNHVAIACSLAAYLLQRPVRIVLNLETNMEWAGKRYPVYADYEVGVNESGAIQYLDAQVYENAGHSYNDSSSEHALLYMRNIYDASRWRVVGNSVKTDVESHTWCRAPGSTEGIAIIENIMEHIANVVNKDPIQVRLANLSKTDTVIPQMIEDLKQMSNYEKRCQEIEEFNKENRWKKRGINLTTMNYPFFSFGGHYGMVTIYGMDGTVAVCHGGIEMGQGINTKVAQVAAHVLGVDLELISVKPTNSLTSPNNAPTAGSFGSESVCYAIKMCCEELNRRLEPIRKELGPNTSWTEVINKAYKQNINLNHSYMFTPRDVKKYNIHGVSVIEVEVDILTGQYIIRRVDILEDAGESMSPEIDIGQIEGALVMALGFYTTEDIIHDPKTGRLLTNRTWTYKTPGAKDIPVDMRITLRKNAPNPTGVFRSKATGEPPFCVACAVVFAVRNALESARKDAGSQEQWFDLELPLTPERVWIGGLTTKEQMTLRRQK